MSARALTRHLAQNTVHDSLPALASYWRVLRNTSLTILNVQLFATQSLKLPLQADELSKNSIGAYLKQLAAGDV